jgi:hypothetical protein
MPRFTPFTLPFRRLVLGFLLAMVAAPVYAAAPAAYNCLAPPEVKLNEVTDPIFSSQDNFNCFAWQTFINLTWAAKPGSPGTADPAVPPSQYGAPDTAPAVVWETFSPNTSVFKADAAKPDPFGMMPPPPAGCSARAPGDSNPLFAMTKLMGDGLQGLSEISQAGMGKFGWVTAQNGKPTYYDVRLNQAEYDYIVSNKLYNAIEQGKAAKTPNQGVLLPTGAVEIKAAWLEITDQALWPRYHMIRTLIVERDPTHPLAPPTCRIANMGLVAIHMIHKTKLAQQFVWTTFEHVDNQPTNGEPIAPGRRYAYFNPNCDPSKDAYKCAVNVAPCKDPTDPKTCAPLSAPNQVNKIIAMPAATASLNADVQAKIRAANPGSVYQYYELVDTLWPSDNTIIPAGARTPLYDGNPQPPLAQGGLLNPLIETYFQGGDPNRTGANNPRGFLSCQSCHVSAPIAKQPTATRCSVGTIQGQSQPGTCSSDYSFLFKNATCPKGVRCKF